MLISVILIIIFIHFSEASKNAQYEDICGHLNNRRIYLELGDVGYLTADNSNTKDLMLKNQTIHNECNLELITCPSCVINVKFTFLNISRNCQKTSLLDTCGCDYVWVYEPRCETSSGEQFCGYFVQTNTSNLYYKSQTRSLIISFMYMMRDVHGSAFLLEYNSQRNKYVIDGYPKNGKANNVNQQITSPFFPNMYPKDLSVEYVINCKSSEKCVIRLIFTDFLISTRSLIEFFDYNGQRMEVATGSLFRPPVVITTGPSLTVRFYANGGTYLGFKAVYHYFVGDVDTTAILPDTNCGGYVTTLGGVITMMNMVDEGTRLYDCVWIVKPPDNYFHQKTHLYIKIVQFFNLAGNVELSIHQGSTSNEPIVEILKHPITHFFNSNHREHVVTVTQGFYITLKGLFRPKSSLAIIYSAFSYKDCYSDTDFLCHNHRCINSYLTCDSFDHCGDNSDERTKCNRDRKNSRWLLSPNFYFPKMYKYANLKLTTVIFVSCSLGLIALIIALIFILYRINLRNGNGNIRSHLQAINDLLGENQITEEIISVTDDPPNYEAPPDYAEVVTKFECSKKSPIASGNQLKSMCQQFGNATEICSTSTSRSLTTRTVVQRSVVKIPDSPPPAYVSLTLDDTHIIDVDETTNPIPGSSSSNSEKDVDRSTDDIAIIVNDLLTTTLLNIDIKLRRSYVKKSQTVRGDLQIRRASDTRLYLMTANASNELNSTNRLQRSKSFENLFMIN